jgi:hypothetical protein
MNNRWLTYLLLASLAYLAILTYLGRFPCIDRDETYFKAAGREWAATGRFAAPELRGIFELEPSLSEVWLPYPPLYPFLFGCVGKMFRFALDAITAFSIKPLLLASLGGVVTALLAFALGAYSLVAYIRGSTVVGWTSLMTVITFLSSVQLLVLGVIGE